MLVIKNAAIYTSSQLGVLEGYDILIENGKITDIDRDLPTGQAEVIDASGKAVLPGLVDAHSHIGGFGVGKGDSDLNEMTNPVTPELEAIYGVDPSSPDFKRVLEYGITTSVITPGSANVVCGTAFALKTYGNDIDEMCLKNPVAMKIALGGNPKNVYGKKGRRPMTRMAIADLIIETLKKAQEYLRKLENGEQVESHLGMENMIKVLRREIPLKAHCEQIDMLTVMRIADMFDVDFTIEHGWGAGNYVDRIARSGIKGMNFGPIGVHKTPGECGIVDIESVIELHNKGVLCSVISDGPIETPHSLVLQIGELVRYGLNIESAIELITINPAKISGVDDRVGSIEIGKDGDIAIFNAIPGLDTRALVEYTIIDGRVVYRR